VQSEESLAASRPNHRGVTFSSLSKAATQTNWGYGPKQPTLTKINSFQSNLLKPGCFSQFWCYFLEFDGNRNSTRYWQSEINLFAFYCWLPVPADLRFRLTSKKIASELGTTTRDQYYSLKTVSSVKMVYSDPEPQFIRVSAILIEEKITPQWLGHETVDDFSESNRLVWQYHNTTPGSCRELRGWQYHNTTSGSWGELRGTQVWEEWQYHNTTPGSCRELREWQYHNTTPGSWGELRGTKVWEEWRAFLFFSATFTS